MRRTFTALAAGLVLGTAALAQGPGYGPGMMGGGGYGPGYGAGYGAGMMGGGYGPGMMGAWAERDQVAGLTDDQRKRINDARQDFWKKQWPLMQQMHTSAWSADQDTGGAFDEQAARRSYDSVVALHKQMFENGLEMRKRIDAVLTPEQRQQRR